MDVHGSCANQTKRQCLQINIYIYRRMYIYILCDKVVTSTHRQTIYIYQPYGVSMLLVSTGTGPLDI